MQCAELTDAEIALEESRASFDAVGDRIHGMKENLQRAGLARRRGDLTMAEAILGRLLETARELEDVSSEVELRVELAHNALLRGNGRAARRFTDEAEALTRRINDVTLVAPVRALKQLLPQSEAKPATLLRIARDGSSFLLAHRIMQIEPELVEGFVLDSIAPPIASLARQDQDANEAGQDFFALCAADATCREKLGDDPWAVAEDLISKLKTGHCPDLTVEAGLAPHVYFRLLIGQLLMDVGGRGLLPSIVYRAHRCAPGDVLALNHLLSQTGGEPPREFFKQWGFVLSNNITMSELWEEPSPTAADLSAWREACTATREVTAGMEPIVEMWPRYKKDAYFGKLARSEAPLLMLQGKFDPATLYRKALPMKEHFTAPSQHWVEVPTATHGVIGSSPTREGRSCGTRHHDGLPRRSPRSARYQLLE